jgi:hypothetical protein
MTGDIYAKIQEQLMLYGSQLITLGGNISPYVGAAIALVLGALLIYLGFKVKARAWEQDKKDAGEVIGGEVGNDQNTTKPVLDQGDDFLDGPKK